MILWAVSQRESLSDAWALLEGAKKSGRELSTLCLGALLAECEQRGFLREEVALLRGLEDTDGGAALADAAAAAAATRLHESATRGEPRDRKRVNVVTAAVWAACGGQGPPPTHEASMRVSDVPQGTPYWKELRLLAHVMEVAEPRNPVSICDAIENFGEDVLNPSGLWLKVAGRSKASVLAAALKWAPQHGSILEIGTYCGYSALRMAVARPGVRIVTLEVDPAHMVIARNIVAFAGLTHIVDVWTGHSKDLLHRLPARYHGKLKFNAVFMDQRGSRYDEDLATLEKHDLLMPGAVVIADNVLKPGSPAFLWRLVKSGAYDTHIVTLREFAMPSEDWMSVSVRKTMPTAAGGVPQPVTTPEAPPEIAMLQWESDRMRGQATKAKQGVTFGEWAEFAEQMKQRMAKLGIEATMDSSELPTLDLTSRNRDRE